MGSSKRIDIPAQKNRYLTEGEETPYPYSALGTYLPSRQLPVNLLHSNKQQQLLPWNSKSAGKWCYCDNRQVAKRRPALLIVLLARLVKNCGFEYDHLRAFCSCHRACRLMAGCRRHAVASLEHSQAFAGMSSMIGALHEWNQRHQHEPVHP